MIYRVWLAIALVLSLASGSTAGAQQAGGSIGVALTVLQPVGTQTVRLAAFSVDGNGVARFETTAPATARATQLVMTSVSSSTTGFVPQQQRPALVAGNGASRLSYVVNVGRSPRHDDARPVELLVEYLTVAGT
jgi:hypothetical protein